MGWAGASKLLGSRISRGRHGDVRTHCGRGRKPLLRALAGLDDDGGLLGLAREAGGFLSWRLQSGATWILGLDEVFWTFVVEHA